MNAEMVPRKRLSREESRAQTRERLLDAAFDLFSTRGIEPTAIEEIAEHAGYSRGAFYSNFTSKDELVLALAEREVARSIGEMQELFATPAEPLERLNGVREYAIHTLRNRKTCVFYLELELYALRRPDLRPSIVALTTKDRDTATAFVDQLISDLGGTVPASAFVITNSFIGLAQGLTLHQMLHPGRLTEEMVEQSLRLFFDAIIKPPFELKPEG